MTRWLWSQKERAALQWREQRRHTTKWSKVTATTLSQQKHEAWTGTSFLRVHKEPPAQWRKSQLPPEIQSKQDACSHTVLAGLARAIREEKGKKALLVGKEEVKPSLFTGDMILRVEKSLKTHQKTPKWIQQNCRVQVQYTKNCVSIIPAIKKHKMLRNNSNYIVSEIIKYS